MGKYWDGSKKVAEIIESRVNEQVDTIYVDDKVAHIPSLPYYISRMEGKEFEIAMNWYQSYQEYMKKTPFVGVLTLESKDTINEFIKTDFEQVQSYMPDKGKAVGYYIIMNDAAK